MSSLVALSYLLRYLLLACLCSFLPLDMSQLTFAILGAVLYALLQQLGHFQPKRENRALYRAP